MARASRLLIVFGLLSALGCTRDNPAFDGGERGDGSETAKADEVGTEKGEESGTGVGETTTTTTTTTTTEGESSSEEGTTAEGGSSSEEGTTAEGGSSSEEGPIDTGGEESGLIDTDTGPLDTGGQLCVAPDPNNLCQLCITTECCQDGIAGCFAEASDCFCVANCVVNNGLTVLQCIGECGVPEDILPLVEGYLECKAGPCSQDCG